MRKQAAGVKAAVPQVRRYKARITQIRASEAGAAEISAVELTESEGRFTDTRLAKNHLTPLRSIKIKPRQAAALEIAVLESSAEKRYQPEAAIAETEPSGADIGKENRVKISLGEINSVELSGPAEIQVSQDRAPDTRVPKDRPGKGGALQLHLREVGPLEIDAIQAGEG